MPHVQFNLRQKDSRELKLLPQIIEFSLKKSNTVRLGSFEVERSKYLRIYFILEGRFNWTINQHLNVLYPGDTVVVLPTQEIGGANGCLEIGTFVSLQLRFLPIAPDGSMDLGKWSRLSTRESQAIGRILMHNHRPVLRVKETAGILQEIRLEIMGRELGFLTRIHSLLECLIIAIARQCTRKEILERDSPQPPQTFTALEDTLGKNLAHQWTVEEMAYIVGLGKTAFAEKIKSYTGFSPLLYLINIRILKAIELLKSGQTNITDIALKTGFYSSQHFSTTFKKFTGHTPGEFRKKKPGLP